MKALIVGLVVSVLSWFGSTLVVAKLALDGLQRMRAREK